MTFEEIQRCISILLEYVSRQGVSSLDVCNADLYWTMTSEDWLVKDTEPKPAVGSLHDDIAELKQLLDEPGRASSVDLDRLASLLRLLSLQLTYPASGASLNLSHP